MLDRIDPQIEPPYLWARQHQLPRKVALLDIRDVHEDKKRSDCQGSLILQAFSQDESRMSKIPFFALAREEQ